jgi:hypothetical protein
MPAFMRSALCLLVLLAACGNEIGDSCIVSSDCATDGTRTCDTSQKSGYCTIQGCDYDTCPGSSACIRFFTGGFTNKTCAVQADCTLDELCSLEGECVPRSSEVRFCMATCGGDGDCRDGYECRTLALMKTHGGEPVLAPGVPIDDHAPKFCATKPAT